MRLAEQVIVVRRVEQRIPETVERVEIKEMLDLVPVDPVS